MTLGAAAAVLLAVVAGGAGLVWADKERAQRVEQARRTVAAVLDEARELRGRALGAEVGDLSGWPAALSEAERAIEVAASVEAEPAVRAEAAHFLDAVRTDKATAEAVAEEHTQNAQLIARLESLRLGAVDDLDADARSEAYAEALGALGVDLAAPEASAARVRKSPYAEVLIAGLDDWAELRPEAREVSRAADDDPWRGRVRQLADDGDLNGLRALADEDLASHPAASMELLGDSLGRMGEADAAVTVYRTALQQHPARLWTSIGLARWLTELSEPAWSEAAVHLRTALAARPRDAGVAYRLGRVLTEQGDAEGALAVLRQAYALDAGLPGLRVNLSRLLYRRGCVYRRSLSEKTALEAYREAYDLDPDYAPCCTNLGLILFNLDRHAEALPYLQRALEFDPQPPFYTNLALVLGHLRRPEEAVEILEVGHERYPDWRQGWKIANDLAGYLVVVDRWDDALAMIDEIETRAPGNKVAGHWAWWVLKRIPRHYTRARLRCGQEVIRRAPDNVGYLSQMASFFALEPDLSAAEYEEAVRLAAKARQLDPKRIDTLLPEALALVRLGKLEEAEQGLQVLASSDEKPRLRAMRLLVLAQIHHRRGESDRAAECLTASSAIRENDKQVAVRKRLALTSQWDRLHEQTVALLGKP